MKRFIIPLLALISCSMIYAQQEELESWKHFSKDLYGGGFEFDIDGKQKVSRSLPVMEAIYDEEDGYILRLEVPAVGARLPKFRKNTVLLFKMADSSVVELPVINKYGADHATRSDDYLLGFFVQETKVTRVHYRLDDTENLLRSDIVKLRFICDDRAHDYTYEGGKRKAFNESLEASITSAKENYHFNVERLERIAKKKKELSEDPASGF